MSRIEPTSNGRIEIRDVLVEQVKIDRSYQREPDMHRVEKIVAEFDPYIFDVISVNDRTGSRSEYYCMIGQHRVLAARKLGLVSVKARVTEKLSVAEEAKIYADEDFKRKNQNPYERFRGRLVYGEPSAVAINNIVESLGLAISNKDHSVGAGGTKIRAVGALSTAYRRSGSEGLCETLALIQEVWSGDRGSWEGYFILGMNQFLQTTNLAARRHQREDLIRKLRTVPIPAIMRGAKARQVQYASSKTQAVADELRGQFNKRRRTTRVEVVA